MSHHAHSVLLKSCRHLPWRYPHLAQSCKGQSRTFLATTAAFPHELGLHAGTESRELVCSVPSALFPQKISGVSSELPCSDVAEGGLSGLSSTGSWTGCGRQEGWGSGEGQNRLHWKGKGQGAMSGNRWAASRETTDNKAPGYESWQNWHYGKDFHPYG